MSASTKKVIATSFVLVAAIGFFLLRNTAENKQPVGPVKAGPKGPIAVGTLLLRSEPLEQKVVATGSLLANEELDLKPEVSGRIVKINFQEGKPVKQGQLLIKLNDSDLRALLEKLQLQLSLSKREEDRAKKLLDQKLISLEEYDAKLNAVQLVQADIEKTKSDIAKTEIYSPFSGVVGLRAVSIGSTISPTTSIAHIQQVSPIKIEFSLPEKYSRVLHDGSAITFSVTGSDRQYEGKVYAFEPKIDPTTRTLKVRATSPNSDGSLTPGAFAKVEITLSKQDDALVVPTTAIVPQIEGQSVFVMSGGKALSRKVVTGLRTDSTIQIVSGLEAGDTIVTTGVMQLHAGMPVKTVN